MLRKFKFLTRSSDGVIVSICTCSGLELILIFFPSIALINLSMSVHFWHVGSLSDKISCLLKSHEVVTKSVMLSLKHLTFCLSYPILSLFPTLLMGEIPSRFHLMSTCLYLNSSVPLQYHHKSQFPRHYFLLLVGSLFPLHC